MRLIVVLDAGPLGLISNPTVTPTNEACNRWVEELLAHGLRVVVPEIADYEVRRELLRLGRSRSIRELDQIKATLEYAPLTTASMLRAAEFWADVRRQGLPTASPRSLDADAVLAGQAATLAGVEEQPVVATDNVGHLVRFVEARHWRDIGSGDEPGSPTRT